MKRTSLCVVFLAFLPGVTNAYYYGCGYGVRYSPYALSYYHSGLVPNDTAYTPYALSYYNSGLVQDYGVYDYGGGYGGFFSPGVFHRSVTHVVSRAPSAVHRAPSVMHRAPSPARRCDQNTGRPPRPSDGMAVIRQHLHAKGVTSVNVDQILRVEDQLLSADFLVKDRNLLIKYWNPEGIEQLSTKEPFKQKAYARYKENWEKLAEQFQQKGGEIYYVNASEPQTIVAALESCPKLSPGNNVETPTVLYAKE